MIYTYKIRIDGEEKWRVRFENAPELKIEFDTEEEANDYIASKL